MLLSTVRHETENMVCCVLDSQWKRYLMPSSAISFYLKNSQDILNCFFGIYYPKKYCTYFAVGSLCVKIMLRV